ncbi:MAG TPA: DUF1819 family protein [Candidatus Wallbacteria bacterium]|mgnify:CR=1 FL=1|nr:DUF1819 family protein [Candidatus Wallbacteria bacterium]
MNKKKYKMSFTTGGLFFNESLKAAEIYSRLRDWEAARGEIEDKNTLQANRASTLKRVSLEICSRLKTLADKEVEYLLTACPHEQRLILWLAVCRRYRFIGQFAAEIIRERFLSMRYELAAEDFNAFFNLKAQWNDGLEKIKPATRAKLRQVFFKIIREAELMAPAGDIMPPIFSRGLIELLSETAPADIFYFPTHEKIGGFESGRGAA